MSADKLVDTRWVAQDLQLHALAESIAGDPEDAESWSDRIDQVLGNLLT